MWGLLRPCRLGFCPRALRWGGDSRQRAFLTVADRKCSSLVLEPAKKTDRPDFEIFLGEKMSFDSLERFREELSKVQNQVTSLLKTYVRNPEMLKLATLVPYEVIGRRTWSSLMVILGMIINCDRAGGRMLSQRQVLACALLDIFYLVTVTEDDLVDNSFARIINKSERELFVPTKMTHVNKMLMSICVSESSKMDPELAVIFATAFEYAYRGQMLTDGISKVSDKPLTNYYLSVENKTVRSMQQVIRALTFTSGASDRVTATFTNVFDHLGWLFQYGDDLFDLEQDLRKGFACGTVREAVREQPVIEEMLERRWRDPGDFEKAVQLVRSSEAMQNTKRLVQLHKEMMSAYLCSVPPSPYTEQFLTVVEHICKRVQQQ